MVDGQLAVGHQRQVFLHVRQVRVEALGGDGKEEGKSIRHKGERRSSTTSRHAATLTPAARRTLSEDSLFCTRWVSEPEMPRR